MTEEPSHPGAAPVPQKKSKAPKIIIIVVCVLGGCCVFGGIGTALLLPAIVRAKEKALEVMCQNNLSQLYKVQHLWAQQHGGGVLPPHTGGQFWLHLATGPNAAIDDPIIFRCPMAMVAELLHRAFRHGPAMPIADVASSGPVGGDKPGNHREGGNILRKDGSVLEFKDPQYSHFAGQLKP